MTTAVRRTRSFNPDRFYIVDWSGNVTISRKSYPSKIHALIAKARRERDTGKTLHVDSGKEIIDLGVNEY